MVQEIDKPEVVTDAVSPEEQELNILGSDNKLLPELIIPHNVSFEQENTEEQEEKHKDEEKELPQRDPTVPEIQVAPSVEPIAVTEQEKEEATEEQEEEEEYEDEEGQSDFRLKKQTDNFLELEREPSVHLQISQLSIAAERGKDRRESEVSTVSRDNRRKSTFTREAEMKRISGDFAVGSLIRIPSKTSTQSSKMQMEEDESEESKPEEAKEEVFDRELYYQMHATLASQLPAKKIKNNFLQKKMVEYFRKRNMEHVFRETDQHIDTQQKYWQRLEAFEELLELDQRHRLAINAELNDLRNERDESSRFVKKTTKELLERERDTSTGLIHTKTGKEISEKVIQRLLHRQWFAVEQVAQYRLKYIKIRNRVTEKRQALQAVDTLGKNLRLVDYEQLKVENRGYADKVEERDEELTKLRNKCDKIFQILAHLREKSASCSMDIVKEQDELRSLEFEHMEARERKNYFKVERDRYRSLTNKLREEGGVLFKPRLLQDMENAFTEVEATASILQKIKDKQKTQLTKVRAIRKNIETAINCRMAQEIEKLTPALSKVSGIPIENPSFLKTRR